MESRGVVRPAARLTLLSAPSGVARRRVAELIRARLPMLASPVPVTTRPSGPGEIGGVHYRFVSPREFQYLLDSGDLLDWFPLGDHRYGIAREPVEKHLMAGVPVMIVTDPASAERIAATVPQARLIWLLPRTGYAHHGPALDPEAIVVVDSLSRAVNRLVGLVGSPARLSPSG